MLRALHEAGVRIDVVAGRGIGAIGALFAAVDGGQRLWNPDGLWHGPAIRGAYGWRTSLRLAAGALLSAVVLLVSPLLLFGVGVLAALAGVLLSLVGLTTASTAVTSAYARSLDALFAPAAIPTVVPRLVVLFLLLAVAGLAAAFAASAWRAPRARRVKGAAGWRLLGAPCSTSVVLDRAVGELWNLIRGAAAVAPPPRADLARRYTELLSENLGQPGFRELIIVNHDVDARRDLVFALLGGNHRQRFFSLAGTDGGRAAEAVDLAGIGRDFAIEALAGAVAIPIATDPHLMRFPADGPWRGETHRLCDRPGGLERLLDEVANAGVEQVIVLSASPGPSRPHELVTGRGDSRGRAAEQLAAFEAAGLRDALSHAAPRFAGLYLIRPGHNPLGPLDFRGVYDERSDRRYQLRELLDQGYEDAHRQFVEPVVAVTGEGMETVQS